MPKKISVIITGASGMAGSGVLHACLVHKDVKKVTTVVRRPIVTRDDKLVEVILDDFLDWTSIEGPVSGHDACFWCLGVSSTDVRKEADYRRITYDFTMAAAKVLEKVDPGMTFCFLSGLGTKAGSRMMWARIKGKAEKDLGNFDLKVYNFRPGYIHPIKGMKSRYLSGRLLYPLLKHSKTMNVEADEFGLAMINAVLFGSEKKTLENVDIKELAERDGPSGSK
jgi:uncharacterized protein YbjT (DUF2867 family)